MKKMKKNEKNLTKKKKLRRGKRGKRGRKIMKMRGGWAAERGEIERPEESAHCCAGPPPCRCPGSRPQRRKSGRAQAGHQEEQEGRRRKKKRGAQGGDTHARSKRIFVLLVYGSLVFWAMFCQRLVS